MQHQISPQLAEFLEQKFPQKKCMAGNSKPKKERRVESNNNGGPTEAARETGTQSGQPMRNRENNGTMGISQNGAEFINED